jgi:hypothetical protein
LYFFLITILFKAKILEKARNLLLWLKEAFDIPNDDSLRIPKRIQKGFKKNSKKNSNKN